MNTHSREDSGEHEKKEFQKHKGSNAYKKEFKVEDEHFLELGYDNILTKVTPNALLTITP
jgi:hypothetical protein